MNSGERTARRGAGRRIAGCTIAAMVALVLATIVFSNGAIAQTVPCQQSGPPACGGLCPVGSGLVCRPSTSGTPCACVPDNLPCDQSPFPQCGGTCSNGATCQANTLTQHCECPPQNLCEQSPFPQCGGQCQNGAVCQPDFENQHCRCPNPCPPCGIPGAPPCVGPPPGPCPPGCTSAGCNSVTSQTILPPDQPAIVYVNLISSCGGAIIKECHPNFPIAGFLTMEEKCCALVAAITGDPACQAAGYFVEVNDCLGSRTFKVTDQCPGSVLSMGISNDPNIFNQEGGGPIPDYEEEVITPSCADPDGTSGNGNDNTGQVTLGGTANGTPIHPGQGPHVGMDVTGASSTGLPVHAEVTTTSGMSAAAIAAQLAQQLQAQGVQAAVVNGRQIRVKPRESPSFVLGPPVGIGITTSDEGITTDTQVAPANLLQAVNGPPVPGLSKWGLISAIGLILSAALAWMYLRK